MQSKQYNILCIYHFQLKIGTWTNKLSTMDVHVPEQLRKSKRTTSHLIIIIVELVTTGGGKAL